MQILAGIPVPTLHHFQIVLSAGLCLGARGVKSRFAISRHHQPGFSIFKTLNSETGCDCWANFLSRAVLPGQPSRATFAGAPFAIHKLWAMCFIVCLTDLVSVTSGPNFLACFKMLRGACVCSCGTRTRSLSAIVSWPCCRRLRHEHNPVLISRAGSMDVVTLSLSLSCIDAIAQTYKAWRIPLDLLNSSDHHPCVTQSCRVNGNVLKLDSLQPATMGFESNFMR